jgi:hypothetical protein
VISLGCGITRTTPLTSYHPVSRCLNVANEFTKAKRTFDQQEALGIQGDNVHRIDPDLHLGDINLDDSSKLVQVAQKVEEQFRDESLASQQLRPLAWKMLASLFYFELLAVPLASSDGSSIECAGRIRCRYGDDLRVKGLFQKLHKNKRISICGQSLLLRGTGPLLVKFRVQSWYQKVDIVLRSNDAGASISGFPESISSILAQQLAATGTMIEKPHCAKFRRVKRAAEQCRRHSKRPKIC